MKQLAFQDCYVEFESGVLTIGNSRIERSFFADESGFIPLTVVDKATGKEWRRVEGSVRVGLPFRAEELRFAAETRDHFGLSEPFLAADLIWKTGEGHVRRTFSVWPGSPFVSMGMYCENIGVYPEAIAPCQADGIEARAEATGPMAREDAIDALPLPRGHYRLHTYVFADKTDQNDAQLRESSHQIYAGGGCGEWDEGNLFLLEDYVRGGACLLVKDAPYNMSESNRRQKDLFVSRGACAQLIGTGLVGEETEAGLFGHGSTVGVGAMENLAREYRAWYKKVWHRSQPAQIMSNTWGDRSQDTAVCHAFMLREIQCAAYLGVDIVQIDDGWQKGHTANSALKKGGVWEGYYKADPEFWSVNREKFPQGLKPLVEKAAESGIAMGLWFSPDSTNDFANWRMDADTILRLWREEHVRHFKLDGVNIRNKRGERNYLRLLEAVSRESGNQIGLNQDITAQIRLGGLYFKQYGNLYVENRYTDNVGYFPHQTLKNQWLLGRWIPHAKMQFEALNPRRNDHLYDPEDLFRPNMYDMDYLFATVMASSPLLWMEMCHLGKEDAERLRGLISVYRSCREDIARADIQSVGGEPDGQSLTGFVMDNGGRGYALLFRESTREETMEVRVSFAAREAKVLATNTEAECALLGDGVLRVRFGKERSYAFVALS